MIDEITEIGNYTFQIRLFDESMNSRATLPEVVNGIEIREPIATEDVSTTNEVGVATVGYALTTAGTTEDAFDTQGNYNKTTWGTGDRITAAKLNKIEAGIDGVNQKVASGGTGGQGMTEEQAQQLSTAYQHSQSAHVQASDIPTKTSDLNNDSNFVNETYVTNAINNAQLGGGSSGTGSNNASDISITDTGNYFTNSDVEGALQEAGSQIKDIENNMQNIGNPTDEQVKSVIDEAIANGDIVAGGLTSTAQTLLISILRNAVFTSNQSENITLLQNELAKDNSESGGSGGSGTTQYVISNNLSNATTSNSAVLVDANASYTATITVNDGYTLETITVTMGGVDITSSVVSGETINISAVTGNVDITVTTIESSSGGGSTELIQDGLVALFDYRTSTVENPYNLTDWGNVAKATFASCEDYFIFNIAGSYTVDPTYGITSNWGPRGIRQTSSPTTSITYDGLSNTVIGLVYGQCVCNIFNMVTTTNMSDEIILTPKYINSSGSTVSLSGVKISARNYKDGPGYSLYALTESETELKLYIDGQLKHTVNRSECTDFVKWYTQEGCLYPYYNNNERYSVAFAIYNRPLSAVEIVEATEYFKAMEVSS